MIIRYNDKVKANELNRLVCNSGYPYGCKEEQSDINKTKWFTCRTTTGKLIGTVTIQASPVINPATWRHLVGVNKLESLFIDQKYQRQGIATKLIERLLLHADKHNIGLLVLDSSGIEGFYETYGFKPYRLEPNDPLNILLFSVKLLQRKFNRKQVVDGEPIDQEALMEKAMKMITICS